MIVLRGRKREREDEGKEEDEKKREGEERREGREGREEEIGICMSLLYSLSFLLQWVWIGYVLC